MNICKYNADYVKNSNANTLAIDIEPYIHGPLIVVHKASLSAFMDLIKILNFSAKTFLFLLRNETEIICFFHLENICF